MADKIRPESVERVKKIREWENRNSFNEAKDIHTFKKYKNYFVPKSVVNKSKTLLSFGVGGDVGFEKLIAWDNNNLKIELFDPTPRSVWHIRAIILRSGSKKIRGRSSQEGDLNTAIADRLHFNPVAYSLVNGMLPFYYDPDRESNKEAINGRKRNKTQIVLNQEQSFSLKKRHANFESVDVEAKNLETILKELKLESVDMLKADIEGLWWEFGNEILDKNINCKFIALEFELNFEKDEKIEPALDKAQLLCDRFKQKNYEVVINRRRQKPMLEMLFIRKDCYEG